MKQSKAAGKLRKYVREWAKKQPQSVRMKKYVFRRAGREVKRLLTALKSCGVYEGDRDHIRAVAALSDLRDIGKLYVPLELLEKGELTEKEREVLNRHPVWGVKILERLAEEMEAGLADEAWAAQIQAACIQAQELCLLHHERYDGGGYPYGLKGNGIPLEVQAVSAADAVVTLRRERKRGNLGRRLKREEAAARICSGECGCFSPEILNALQAAPAGFGRNYFLTIFRDEKRRHH